MLRLPNGPAGLRLIGSAILCLTIGGVMGAAAWAQEVPPAPSLGLPVACEIGRLCTIQNYFDADPGPEAKDYTCGDLTYDGHRGTDFQVPDLAAMAAGVPVVAAASGRVRAIRDSMPDIDAREVDPATIEGRDAGNAVVIEHGDGWESQYSHLRRGSVIVAPGDRVTAGQTLGLIGMSGRAEFPHLHFAIRLNDRHIDPFVGLTDQAGCGDDDASPLWNATVLDTLRYSGGGLLSRGFAAEVPDYAAIRRGALNAESLPRNAPALLFWFNLYGIQEGDVIAARLIAPNGSIVAEQNKVLDRTRAQWFGYLGRRRPGDLWPPGLYRGEFTLRRPSGGTQTTIVETSGQIRLQ